MPAHGLKHRPIYMFDQGECEDKRLLGGKGAGLCAMTRLGLPVPPGFTITTEVCKLYYRNGRSIPSWLMDELRAAVLEIERRTGKGLGDDENPLLLSVRSGAPVSMPGMMDTILNLGLNDVTVEALARRSGDIRFAYDSYRRFIELYGRVVLKVDGRRFAGIFESVKEEIGVEKDHEVPPERLKELVKAFKKVIVEETGEPFPQEPYVQLGSAVAAVFDSWNTRRAISYRERFRITPDVADGTGVNVMTMVFGNMGDNSATGVLFTRDPASGVKGLYGDYLINAQGEDVVAGTRTPGPIFELKDKMPRIYEALERICQILEGHYREPQDIEFTVEQGELYILQTRSAKMTPAAMVRTSVEMAEEGLIDRKRAVTRISPDSVEQFLHKRIDPSYKGKPIAEGMAASPGAATGIAVFDADEAERRRDENTILIRVETRPDDVHGFFASQGILTSRGGKTSHAAVVARGIGKPCVVGASAIRIDEEGSFFEVKGKVVREGDIITIDGSTGEVFLGEVPLIEPEMGGHLETLLSWADGFRRLGVRANADTPEAASVARKFGAEGIGLCRTERMFNAPDRLPIIEKMILADTDEERARRLESLLPMQKGDFKAILKEMEGLPVTIRLLDPPLHEFLPSPTDLQRELYEMEKREAPEEEIVAKRKLLERARELSEVNPMLGDRGVRIALSRPEIYEMQIRGLLEAACELREEGVDARPQIMVPQVSLVGELLAVKGMVEKVIDEVRACKGVDLDPSYGTMIEVVRAALNAAEIADEIDFFSFGTNDLTQATFSFSREDAEAKFLPNYMEKGLIKDNPFHTLDVKGVGKLIDLAVSEGRRGHPNLEIGICGEHGGDPRSIQFFHKAGLDYVSCSPYRILVARLATAQAALDGDSPREID